MRGGASCMALRLFEHNEKAYHAAVRMMEQYGKDAIVHLTGTGKSYVAFKLIEDNPEKVVIWLSPSEYIFKTQLESLKRNDPDFPLANVHFYTYAKLMCCTQAQLDEIAAQKFAYLILDEFHRAGAECWGKSTVALLRLCPDVKLLGLTATNIRYLDNNRDMAEELFDGHIASNMNLGETVVRGVLSTRNYAKYQMQGDNLRSTGVQDVVCQTYSDALNTDKTFTDFKIDKLRSVFDTKREKSDASDREKSEKTSLPRSDTVATKQRAGQLSRQKIAQSDSIGMIWGNRDERQWNERYQEAKCYFDDHGDLNVPAEYVSPCGYNLGNWVKRQRYTSHNPEKSCAVLTEARIAKLDEIGMRWGNRKQATEASEQNGLIFTRPDKAG